MTKREIRKAAYRLIVKEKKKHQDVFDELSGKTDMEPGVLAKLVAAMPSPEKQRQNKILVIVYLVFLGLVIVTRSLGILGLSFLGGMNGPVLIILLGLGLVVPGVGIYGALTSRTEMYYSTSGLLIYSIFRALTKDAFMYQSGVGLIFVIPTALVIVLGFILPYRLKTPFREQKVVEEKEGRKLIKTVVQFEESETPLNPDILDA